MQHLDAAGELFSQHGAKLYLDQVLAGSEILKAEERRWEGLTDMIAADNVETIRTLYRLVGPLRDHGAVAERDRG